MIIFNDTVIVEESVHQQWLKWMQEVYIPKVMETGHFKSYQVLNVIDSPNEGVTTCIQYNTDSEEKFAKFYNQHLHGFHASHNALYENRFVLYSTLMETIAEGT